MPCKKNARRVGAERVAQERKLDRVLASGHVSADKLRVLLERGGALDTELRRIHSHARIEQRALLKSPQVEAYDRLRGYGVRARGHAPKH